MKAKSKEVYSVEIERDQESGAVISQSWFNNEGKMENPDGPAYVEYDQKTGEPRRMYWMIDGEYHRKEQEGPARIRFDPNDGEMSEEFFWKGNHHRLSGPAIVISNRHSGQIYSTRHADNGRFYTPRQGGGSFDL